MKKSRLEYIIPAALALVITIGLIRFIPMLTREYVMEVIDTETTSPEDYRYYYDLDGDGTSELFTIYYNTSGNLSISVAKLNMATINQFNLPGRLTELGATLDLHDIDSNGIADIFVCTEKSDSLFLTIIDDLYGHPTTTREYFLDKINQYNDDEDYLFSPGDLSDLNGDGTPEYILAINGGHSLQPRRVYAIDYRNDTVWKSPLSGAAIVSIDLFDLDQDGAEEVLLNTVAPENFKIPFPFRDSISWLMVLDENLQFYKPPLELNRPPSWVSLEPFIHEGNHYMMAYHRYRELDDYHAMMAIYNDSLEVVKSKIIRGYQHSGNYMYRVPGGFNISDIKFLHKAGILTYDFDLQCTDSLSNDTHFGYGAEFMLDVDADGEKEFVFITLEQLHIFRSDFRESAEMDVQIDSRNPRTLISLIEDGDAYPILFVQFDNFRISANYVKNQWFRYRGVVYPGIFIILFGLFNFLTFLQKRLVTKRYEKDRLISRLQLQSIRNQLDPHFTYNALNAVGSLIYKEEKDLAYQYLKGLTDLLRMVSGDTADITWIVSDELEFVGKYLEIEKLRFREKFNYHIEVEEDRLKQMQVPKMSVLTFVENAIKHGLNHKQEERQLNIKVVSKERGMRIGIRDNGIGRAAASKYNKGSAGAGIEMMKLYFKQFSEATGKKVRFEIKDQFEYDLKAAGTLVEITIR